MRPEAQLADWWTNPRLAYGRGLVDGYENALREVMDEMFGPNVREGVRSLIRAMDSDQARRHQTQTGQDRDGGQPMTPDQPGSWPTGHHDWPGLENMTTGQRIAAYRRMIASWEQYQ